MQIISQLYMLTGCILFSISALGQNQKFNAGIIAGLNFSTLEGREITDYYGLNVGIMGTARLSKHAQVGMEFLFSQNGEYILPEFYPDVKYGTIWLNHLEIPVHVDWLMSVFKKDAFHDWNLNLGIAYTRLLGYRINDASDNDLTEEVLYKKKTGYQLQAGTSYFFTKNIGLNLKASLPIKVEGLEWTVAARVVYVM